MAITTLSEVKTLLSITDTDRDALIEALIPEVEADYLIIRNWPFDTDDLDATVYPDGSALVAAQMIGFHLHSAMKTGGAFSSESIGSYSYSRADDGGLGYPKAIIARIKRYVSSR